MNIIGHFVRVVDASDPTIAGRSGEVVLETAKTLLLTTSGENITIQKKGTVLLLADSNSIVTGDDVMGRLEDRLRSKRV
jgi:RNase P/RNase MRP subunit p29